MLTLHQVIKWLSPLTATHADITTAWRGTFVPSRIKAGFILRAYPTYDTNKLWLNKFSGMLARSFCVGSELFRLSLFHRRDYGGGKIYACLVSWPNWLPSRESIGPRY